MTANLRFAPDQVLADISDYVLDYKIQSHQAIDAARLHHFCSRISARRFYQDSR
jgi:hypothetical protein